MFILFFIDGLRIGGKERRFLELIKQLEQTTIDYRIVMLNNRIEYRIDKTVEDKIIIIKKSFKKSILPIFKFYQIVKIFKPNIIHTWSNIVTFYALLASVLSKTYLINSQITDSPLYYSKFNLGGVIRTINFIFSDLIISNSYAGLKTYGVSDLKGKVIHNGIDLTRFNGLPDKFKIKQQLGIKSEFVVIMVASFTNNKDYKTFIDIAYSCQNNLLDITFIAVGDGYNFMTIKDYARNKKLSNILLMGKRDDIEYILKSGDIGILVSTNGEGISNSVLEYMATGLPVIVNTGGGNIEIVEDTFNGYLIDKDYTHQFTEKITYLIQHNHIRKNMGLNARKTIEQKFEVSKMYREFISLYKNVT